MGAVNYKCWASECPSSLVGITEKEGLMAAACHAFAIIHLHLLLILTHVYSLYMFTYSKKNLGNMARMDCP